MPLTFPIAADARAALDAADRARTQDEARTRAGEPVTLVSDWLRPTDAEHAKLSGRLEEGVALGFVQAYEDAKGRPVLAVTYWRRMPPAPPPRPSAHPPGFAEDDTDDLYFARRRDRRKASRAGRSAQEGQLDLFPVDPAKTAEAAPEPPPEADAPAPSPPRRPRRRKTEG